ncbi:MAG: ABC transporter ATP-binding protein [Dehalococcoidia bacterium]|nr:ABC transporter ATP-binding protein [Dehalococcoidia bacterium]MSQ16451.1 ABC transporter ATP-binding protein [Dehalococcoidia bacterium]
MIEPLLRATIQKQIGSFHLEVELSAGPGVLLLFGPSGAGKTQTLNAIAGLSTPDAGEVVLNGKTLFCRGPEGPPVNLPARERQVGYVFQDYALFPHLTVEENIAFGLPPDVRHEAPERVLELVQTYQLDGLEQRRPLELSGGQQQRVALARALASNPQALLLDEPFSSLDAELRRELRRELRNFLRAAHIPVVLVTHDREDALALGDMVQVIDGGRCLAQGEPLQVLGQPGQGRVARLVGVENLLPLRVERCNSADGTMVCVGEGAPQGLRLEVPLADCREGEQVTVGLRASDIILAGEEPRHTSARNRLQGVVTRVEPRPPGYEVVLDCGGVPLCCRITGSSLTEMGIRPGQTLWAVFKASSCFLVQE